MLVGLGGAVIALILGIAAYKIVMAAQHALDQGITAIVAALSAAAGAIVVAGIAWAIVELRHRHQRYGSENRARNVLITKLEAGEIRATFDASPQIDTILNPSRKALDSGVYTMKVEQVDSEDVLELPARQRYWEDTLDRWEAIKADEWVDNHESGRSE